MPRCHLKSEADREQEELKYLYQIANVLPGFLRKEDLLQKSAHGVRKSGSPLLNEDVKPYYRDYIHGTDSEWISVFTYYVL